MSVTGEQKSCLDRPEPTAGAHLWHCAVHIAPYMTPHMQQLAHRAGPREVIRCLTFKGLMTRFRERARTASMPLLAPSVRRIRDSGYCHGDCSLFEEVVRGRHPCLRATHWREVIRPGREIQSQYAKKAFEAYVAQASKIGEMYVGWLVMPISLSNKLLPRLGHLIDFEAPSSTKDLRSASGRCFANSLP